MIMIGIFLGVFIGLIIGWAIYYFDESDFIERGAVMMIILCATFAFLVFATYMHYEMDFEKKDSVEMIDIQTR